MADQTPGIADQTPGIADQTPGICLATLVAVRGSAPQVPGASALFSEQGLLAGTLGGGVLEGDALKQANKAVRTGKYRLYDFRLDDDISDKDGALCGGSATILLDPDPAKHLSCFREMHASLENGQPGCMITLVRDTAKTPIQRAWLENDHLNPADISRKLEEEHWEQGSGMRQKTQLEGQRHEGPGKHAAANLGEDSLKQLETALSAAMNKGTCTSLTTETGDLLFIEPVFPMPRLVIAGAGHVGKALSHFGKLLDFEVTVIDDRAEFANAQNLPDADYIIAKPIGKAMSEIPKTSYTYVVIVTRGHHDDATALKACIGHDLPYIGMIGSRKKIRTLKGKFITEGWSTREAFEKVHAPIGLEIGSVSVQEIALSISAQLVQVRSAVRKGKKREQVTSVILAAGESSRMGKPKMLLPYGDSTMIGTVAGNATNAVGDHVRVVLGANAEAIRDTIADLEVETVLNPGYQRGMLSSVQAGIRNLPPGTTAVMILLGDQPMIRTHIMDRLIEQYKQSEKTILVASANGKRGHPVIFSTDYIPEILAYGPDGMLRQLLEKHSGEVEELETGHEEILRDIDTPADYENERHQHDSIRTPGRGPF
jgi:xanthine dehydrogenase accessory factor